MDGNQRAGSRSSQLAAYKGRPGVGWQARTVFDYFDCRKRKKQDGLGLVSTSSPGEERNGGVKEMEGHGDGIGNRSSLCGSRRLRLLAVGQIWLC